MSSLQNHRSLVYETTSSHHFSTTHFSNLFKTHISTQRPSFIKFPTAHSRNALKSHLSTPSFESAAAHLMNSVQNKLFNLSDSMGLRRSLVIISLMAGMTIPSPSFAAGSEELPDKVNLETIVNSIDEFFNRNPFFVAGVTFIWLVVIPLTKEYMKKYKQTSAINVFRKLKDDPSAQLLDIRNKQSQMYMGSPNLKILGKNVIQVEFSEGGEGKFLKEVLSYFQDPAKTVLCVLDNFDGNSLKAAELLVQNGFKEAYAIKGGLRGKDGWQEIQEKFLPPSVHVYARKKKNKKLVKLEVNGENVEKLNDTNGQLQASANVRPDENWSKGNGCMKHSDTSAEAKLSPRPLSPYPKYQDLKPPSSPTPSKP